MNPRLSLALVPFVLCVSSLHAQQPFPERYALAADRAALLKELVPGTDDYYFYHTIFQQTQGAADKAAALLKEWEEASSGPNGRRDILKNRAALLGYSKDPEGTLKWLREKLELEFDHQRESEEARAELPTALDQSLVSFAAFEKKSLAGAENLLSNVTDAGLYRITKPLEQWTLTEIRALLKRLTRPDLPGLVGVIHRELNEKDAAFGKFPIHTLLTSDQLAELQKLRPDLINNTTFTTAVMTRMRPTEFEDADRDPAVRRAWLDRLWAYAATLNPNANPLKANLLYHLLALDEKQGRFDAARLLAYLKLPRPVRYISAQYRKDHPELWKFPAALDFDPASFTGTAPVGDDEALVRRLLIRYLTTEKEDAIAPLISAGLLNDLLAEAKLTTGAEEPQKWMSLLSPESLQSLKDRVDIEFDAASPQTWAPEDVVKLDVWVKNVPSLLVRIYEINTANVHRTGAEVDTDLDLDGLTANHERKLDLNTAPILRTKQTFTFPELSAPRGVWIVEFIGNGKASRALIRKGGLRTIVRQTSAGTAVTVLDEKLKPVPAAFAMVGPKQFKADEKGLILLPLSTQPGPQKVIFDDGTGFTALETIELQGEKYELEAGFHVPRESLLPGNKATLLVRPRLTSNGRPVLLESLEKVKITIASQTLDGTPATAVFPIEKLVEDKETTVEFTVPDRLKTLTFSLSGEVKSQLTGATLQLTTADPPPDPIVVNAGNAAGINVHVKNSAEVNTITASGQVSDLHLSRSGVDWVLHCLGLNGEPRPNREVEVSFYRPEFLSGVDVVMKTDASGSIRLGPLSGLHAISATSEVFRPFDLQAESASLPRIIQINAGGALAIPWPTEKAPDGADIALFERRGDAFARRLELPEKVTAGSIVWKDLPAGTYSLFLRDNETTVRVSPGDIIDGHAISPASVVQLTGSRFLNVGELAEADAALPDGKTEPALVFHIGNRSPETRVHVFASRFVTPSVHYEFQESVTLQSFPFSDPSATKPAWFPSVYLSTRSIGDEYRYVLDRRNAAKFAGNMLARPGLLINPWEIAETETEKQELEVLQKAMKSELLPDPAAPMDAPAKPGEATPGSFPVTPTTPPDPPSDLSFLATPGPVALNLKPDANGNVVIPRAALGDRQYVRVVALDSESSAVRDFSFTAAALPPRDLRLARHLNPAMHFSQQNRVTLLTKDAPFRFDDALAAQFQALGHLGAVHQLFLNLTQNPQLAEFSWLLEWKTFDDAKKRQLYSQYACHELSFFLSRKDRPFFDAVIKPYLASKHDKTFLDDYLLGTDLTRYLGPWPYAQLNTLERLLLAERIQADQPAARRSVQDWLNNQAPNPQRDLFLFETALRGRALMAQAADDYGVFNGVRYGIPGSEGRTAGNQWEKNGRADWYFSTNLRQPLKPGENAFAYVSPSIVDLEIVKRQERVRGSLDSEKSGDQATAAQDYGLAFENYRQALNTIPNGTSNQTDRSRMMSKFSRAAVIHAKELGHIGEFDKAKALLGEVLAESNDPENRDAQNLLRQIDDPDRFNQAVTPKHLANTEEVRLLFNKGQAYYELGQFAEAETEFNRILAIDPYNTAARRQLERTEREITNHLKSARDHTRLRMLNSVENLWVDDPEGDTKSSSLQTSLNGYSIVRNAEGFTYGYNSIAGARNRVRLGGKTSAGGDSLVPNFSNLSSGTNDLMITTMDFDAGVGAVPEGEVLARFTARGRSGRDRLFRQQDPTKVWAEQNYYRLPIEQQTAALVPVNRFWRDYALWDGKAAFVSTNVADAAGTFAEMVLALAVLDLPFPGDFQSGKAETKDNVLTLTPAGPGVLFHQDILPAEPDTTGAKLLVSQSFYREGDRYIEQAGEKTDKFVSAEFLTGAVYGCQVVVTNPSSSRQRLDVLFQIPAGALPVKATRRVQSLPVMIEPYRTQTLDFHFYFPQAGKFAHFPVHISRGEKTAASAPAFTFNVVEKPTINDPASWDFVSQHGTDKEVLAFLDQHNLNFLDLEQILWRLKNADFFRAVITLLKARHHYDDGVWSYAALHNVQPHLREFLQESSLTAQCGPVFTSELLTVNPVEEQIYQHLEYSPLINARAHALGGERKILNDKFASQWASLMNVLSYETELDAGDQLAVAVYLAAQDRIEDAIAAFAKVDRAAVAEKLQYEYLRAWLAMCQEDTVTASRIASALANTEAGAAPAIPRHWQEKFAALAAQLEELAGKAPADGAKDRDAEMNTLASRDPSFTLAVENRTVTLTYRNLEEITVNYYPVDLEFLFSSSPFLSMNSDRAAAIRPAASERIMLPAGGKHSIALPAAWQQANVLVEIRGGGLTKSTAIYAHALDVQISEAFGQLTVRQAGDQKPLSGTYVKVFAEIDGKPVFYKDGYADLRGKFDFASLSTSDLDGARRFAILVLSEKHGAMVKEVKPPSR